MSTLVPIGPSPIPKQNTPFVSNTALATWNSAVASGTAVQLYNETNFQTVILTFAVTEGVSSGTIALQGSNDGVNWQIINGVIGSGYGQIWQFYPLWQAPTEAWYSSAAYVVSGWQYVQLVLENPIVGTGSVTFGFCATNLPNGQPIETVVGVTPPGTVAQGSPVLIAGVDTNGVVHTILTDGSGRIIVAPSQS